MSDATPRTLLMVANYFPPMASGGTARQLRFIRYLPEFGWRPVVLSAKATGPVPDPAGVEIHRAAAPGLEGAYALGRRLSRPGAAARSRLARGARLAGGPARPAAGGPGDDRSAGDAAGVPTGDAAPPSFTSRRGAVNAWLMVPDEYMGWIAPGIRLGIRLLEQQHFDAIFSSYPRGSTHLIAAALAEHSGLPWLADYRDPWPTHQFRRYPTTLHRKANFALEEWALQWACGATATNEPIAEDLRRRYPDLARAVCVLPNGYDPEEPVDDVDLGPGFWLVHTGRLYSRLEAAQRFLEAFAGLPDDVNVLFLGIDGPQLRERADRLGIGHRVRIEPFSPRARARGAQRAADAQLLITGLAPEALSSKIFEYLEAGKPILAMTPEYSSAAKLLGEVGGGRVVPPAADLAQALAAFVADVRGGAVAPPRRELVERFDGRRLTGELARFLDAMVG